MSLGCRIVALAAAVVNSAPILSQDVGEPVEQVSVMVNQVVEHHLSGCHLVLITTSQHSHITSAILRNLAESVEAGMVVEAGSVSSKYQLEQVLLFKGLWHDVRTICRGLIIDLTDTNSTSLVLGLLEESGLWMLPETVVVMVGGMSTVKEVLLHHSLRNTVNALYLALDDVYLHLPPLYQYKRLMKVLTQERVKRRGVMVYRRCLFCNNGEADVQLIHLGNLHSFDLITDNLFPDQFHNFNGHMVRVSSSRFFPYSDYTSQTGEQASLITLRDCIDSRLLSVFSSAYNFSMETREAPERSWGSEVDGKFNGMLGLLQREEADFVGPIGSAVDRMKVMIGASAYEVELVCLVSLSPSPLPQHLSIIRPFTGALWLVLMASEVTVCVILWLLLRTWKWITRTHVVRLSTAFLYSWGTLLNKPPKHPSVSYSGKVLVGVWLVFCLVITTGYSSSLIAHLTVQSKSKPPETLEDLVSLNNWRWGIESWMMKGSPGIYFSTHTDPVVKLVYKKMEVVRAEEALSMVKEGSYTLISGNYYITVIIQSFYTNKYGQSPYYISYPGISFIADFGWGFRKGAPYYRRFNQLLLQLKDSGITEQWFKEVIAARVRENKGAALYANESWIYTPNNEGTEELRLYHLQGAFYLLFVGYIIACLVLLGEKVASFRSAGGYTGIRSQHLREMVNPVLGASASVLLTELTTFVNNCLAGRIQKNPGICQTASRDTVVTRKTPEAFPRETEERLGHHQMIQIPRQTTPLSRTSTERD
ncbi:ionotropic receptor 21a-like [Cherax quadricarinatus]|uniref:ionotropic receptor 21a-like n=1 Tax=Cherax quadricarinatus TaxID=27406 RepID=UPI00387E5162